MNQQDKRIINLSDFQYELPDEYIAHVPPGRGKSKLMVYKEGQVRASQFADLPDWLPAGSMLVFNQSKVIPARIQTHTAKGKRIELFLLKPGSAEKDPVLALNKKASVVWECMVGRKKDWPVDEGLKFYPEGIELTATWENRDQNRIHFAWEPATLPFAEILEAVGKIPLPPYIQREVEDSDKETYQTVYAKTEGSVAAPTAGLHFTDDMLDRLKIAGHDTGFVTLHVGAGTFMPVKTENMMEHEMHTELISVERSFIEKLAAHSGPLVPVGTTSLRVLESLWHLGASERLETLVPQFPETAKKSISMQDAMRMLAHKLHENGMDRITAETSIMIYPGYTVHACDALITNFHQPGSTLLLLVSALIGDDWKNVYTEAMQADFRFLSYGDSSLLFRKSAKPAQES